MIAAFAVAVWFAFGRGGVQPRTSLSSIPAAPISLNGAHVRGSSQAKLALVEYSDFECPFCGKSARETWPAIDRDYVQTGKILAAFVNFPLEEIHPFSKSSAAAAECAAKQGRFWEMHEKTFGLKGRLQRENLATAAEQIGLNIPAFDSCIVDPEVKALIDASQRVGQTLGILGTPSFFLGRLENNQVHVIKRFEGFLSVTQFSALLEETLKAVR